MTSKYHPKKVRDAIRNAQLAETKEDKIKALKAGDTMGLRCLLRLQYDPAIKHSLPEGFPWEDRDNHDDDCAPGTLNRCWTKYVHFLDVGPMPLQRKELLFQQTVNSLDKRSQDLLIAAKDRKLDIGLTKKEIEKALPNIFAGR
jgi:hypothetical protein